MQSSPTHEDGFTKKKRILVVDDEPALTRIIVRFLESDGRYEVIAINDATKAVQAARVFLPDLVVLDIVMADLDGGEILAQLRAEKELADVQAIFLTGLVSKAEIGREGSAISGLPVIPKPVVAHVLRAAVARQLGIEE